LGWKKKGRRPNSKNTRLPRRKSLSLLVDFDGNVGGKKRRRGRKEDLLERGGLSERGGGGKGENDSLSIYPREQKKRVALLSCT